MTITSASKNILLVAMAALIVVLVAVMVCSKPPRGMPPPPPNAPGETTTITGIVKDFGSNPMGDIDKLLLLQNGADIWLSFPPHTALQITAFVKKNEQVSLQVHIGNPRPGYNNQRAEIVSITNAEGKTFDVRSIAPPRPAPGELLTVQDTKIRLNKDDDARVMSMIIADKVVVLPRHVQQSLLPLLMHAKQIIVQGYQRNPADGFVNKSGYNLVKPVAITIDSIKYMVE